MVRVKLPAEFHNPDKNSFLSPPNSWNFTLTFFFITHIPNILIVHTGITYTWNSRDHHFLKMKNENELKQCYILNTFIFEIYFNNRISLLLALYY